MKLSFIFDLLPQNVAFAHCDIPCGIYDPHQAQVAVHTIIRMTELLGLIKRDDELKAEHDVSRVTHVKEEHSNILEHELGTLEKDYFKEEHYSEYKELKSLFEIASRLGAKTRQGIDMESGKDLLETVMQISEVFFKSKGLESHRVKAPYPTDLEIVVQS
ncbi:MAG: superoxide dismutase, Ni [Candidatus Levybacteria bacterium]|nr:superoxide dismutase, Ni [Candidatus Levybacteria bacterium]